MASVASPFGEGGRLTKDGRIGVATLNYKESTNDIEPDDLKDVQDAAFTARSDVAPGRARRPRRRGRALQREPGARRRASASSPPRSSCCSRSDRSWRPALPLIATLLALGCALGVITLISHVVDTPDFATQLASLIGLGVGIDYSLFVVTRFRSEVRAGCDRDVAIENAIDKAGRTVMFAAITVVIALLGLLLLGLSFMHGVALGAAAAVLAVMFSALTIIPALIGGSGLFMDGVLRRIRPARGLPLLGHEAPHPHPRPGLAGPASGEARAPLGRGLRLGALDARRAAPTRGWPRASRSWCSSAWRSRR